METIFSQVRYCPLFRGVTYSAFQALFEELQSLKKGFAKNETILHRGDSIDSVGIVLAGSAQISKQDIDGNQVIITELFAQDMFGEVFACLSVDQSPVEIVATSDCEILFINYKKIIALGKGSCDCGTQLIENMLTLFAQKNLVLTQRIEVISKRSLREKILCFLQLQSKGKQRFCITFNRDEMARYVCADRSALSNELSKMQKEGLIRYQKNEFEILSEIARAL